MKRFLLVAAVLCLALTSCTKSNQAPTSSSPVPNSTAGTNAASQFTLLYDADDTFCPFSCKTKTNLDLAPLLYDSLYQVDLSFGAVARAAQSATLDKTTCTVTLKSGMTFWDGSALTSSDVVYSYRAAAKSPVYRHRLSGVSSCRADGNSVVFRLKQPDIAFLNCLDFPIIKANSDKSLKKGAAPIGSGLFSLKTENNKVKLVYHQQNKLRNKPYMVSIDLITLPDSTAVLNSLEIGTLSYSVMELADGRVPSIKANTAATPINHLVYLGVNCGKAPLDNVKLRQAVAHALDRDAVVNKGFFGNAYIATSPFNPSFSMALATAAYGQKANTDQAGKLLGEAGFQDKPVPTFSLLITDSNDMRRSAANQIVAACKKVGIKLTLVSLPYEEYLSKIRAGDYDFYLGETKIAPNMDLTSVLKPEGELAYGVPKDGASYSAFVKWRSGEIKAADFVAAFVEEVPWIPLCYRTGLVAYSRNLSGSVMPAFSDPYSDFGSLRMD